MVYLLQKYKRKLGREVEHMKTLAHRAAFAQRKKVTWSNKISREDALSVSRMLTA